MAVPASGMLSGLNLYAAPIPCQYGQTVLVSGCDCDGIEMPKYLTATFAGDFAGLGSITLTWNASNNRWEAFGLTGSEYCGITVVYLLCEPVFHNWTFFYGSYSYGITNSVLTLADCSPFSLSGTITSPAGGSCSAGSGSVTVSGNVPIVRSGGGSHSDYWLAVYTNWMLSGLRLFAAADCNPDRGYVSPVCFDDGNYPYYVWATVHLDGGVTQGSYLLTWNPALGSYGGWRSSVIATGDGCLAGAYIELVCGAIDIGTGTNTYIENWTGSYDPFYMVSDFSGYSFLTTACSTTTLTVTITSVPANDFPFDPPSGIVSGVRAMFRLATIASGMYSGSILSGMLSGRRLYVAERDPCCDGGPLFSGFPTSGITSGETVACCTEPIPSTLSATFGGSLASIGTISITWNGTAWAWSGSACGMTGFSVTCIGGTTWSCGVSGSISVGPMTGTATTCDPFLLSISSTCFFSSCSTGAFTITISP